MPRAIFGIGYVAAVARLVPAMSGGVEHVVGHALKLLKLDLRHFDALGAFGGRLAEAGEALA